MSYQDANAPTKDGILKRWETSHKLIGLMALIFSFAFIRNPLMLPAPVIVAGIVYYLSGLSFSYLLSRMRIPGIFLLVFALFLIFGSGNTIIMELGPLSLRYEGVVAFLLIAVKFICIFLISLSLFAGTPMVKLASGLKSIGIPFLLTEMILFTYRYIHQLSADMNRTKIAAGLRGYKGKSVSSFKTLAYIIATLLVHSYDQSERIFQAMMLRGYGETTISYKEEKPVLKDRLALAGCLAVALALIFFQAFSPLPASLSLL